jgi:hypothetical protein
MDTTRVETVVIQAASSFISDAERSLLILNSVLRYKDEDDRNIKTVDTVQETVSNIYKTSHKMRNRYS